MSTTTKWGLITGMVYVIINLVVNMTGVQQPGSSSGMGTGLMINSLLFVATFATIFLGVKETRDEDLNGFLTLSQGFKAGLKIAFIAGLIAGIFTFIYMQFIDPEFSERMMSAAEDQLDEKDVPEESREMALKFSGFMANPIFMGAFMIIWVVFWGLIKSLFSGMILKKDPPVTYPTA